MYFWNITAVAKDLKQDKITQNQQVKYYISVTIIYMLLAQIPRLVSRDPEHEFMFGIIIFLLQMAIVVWGILYCYRINEQGDDREFQKRFVALSVPATMRHTAWAFLAAVPVTYLIHKLIAFIFIKMGTTFEAAYPHLITLTQFSYDLLLLLLTYIYYKDIGKHIGYIASDKVI